MCPNFVAASGIYELQQRNKMSKNSKLLFSLALWASATARARAVSRALRIAKSKSKLIKMQFAPTS